MTGQRWTIQKATDHRGKPYVFVSGPDTPLAEVVPASELARLKAALEQLCDRVERDRREPDKLLCNVLSARVALRSVEREPDV